MKHTLGNMLAGTFKANSSLMFIHHLEKYVHVHVRIYSVLLLLAIHLCTGASILYLYCTITKEGPWVVHLTLGQDWGRGRYSRYQCRI